jgi:two-component system NarL family response regulator
MVEEEPRNMNRENGLRKINILIADERPIVQEGMIALFGSQPDMEVVNAEAVVNPDVVFYDFAPFLSTFGIVKKYPSAKVVVFTDCQSEEHIYQAVQAGARAYLDKSASLQQILDCIRTVMRGQTWIPQHIAELLARRMMIPQLTRREQSVLFEMAQGKSNKQIGLALGLSPGTVKVHMTHILGKLKVSGRLEALAAATARGLVQAHLSAVEARDLCDAGPGCGVIA